VLVYTGLLLSLRRFLAWRRRNPNPALNPVLNPDPKP
jgi:hypothetical protein